MSSEIEDPTVSSNFSSSKMDLDTLLQSDATRKLFSAYLKEFNNSSDNLLTLYLICCCCQNQSRVEDRQRMKQILEMTYNTCFIKNQLPYLNSELKQKLSETLQKTTYNESVFSAVKKELKLILQEDYFPKFIKSKAFKDYLKLSENSAPGTTGNKRNLDEIIDPSYKENCALESTHSFVVPSIPKTTSNTSLTRPTKLSTSNKSNYASSSASSSASSLLSVQNANQQLSNTKKKKTTTTTSSLSSQPTETGTGLIRKANNFLFKSSSASGKQHKSAIQPLPVTMPPNPYHVVTSYTQLPVSCQDSEIQSMVSANLNGYDSQLEDENNTTDLGKIFTYFPHLFANNLRKNGTNIIKTVKKNFKCKEVIKKVDTDD
jgi:hypothetical protein